MPSRTSLYAAMLIATFLWGSQPPAGKAIVEFVGPPQQALVRGLSAFVILSLFSLVTGGTGPLRAALSRPGEVALQGFLSFFLSSLTNLTALSFSPASLIAVLTATYPLMLAVTEPREVRRALPGMLLALAGIVVVVGGDDPRQVLAGGVDLRGVALGLLTAATIAGSQRYGQRTARRGDPVAVLALSAGAALVPLLAYSLVVGDPGEIVRAPGGTQLLLVYLGIFCTAINFGLWYWALKYVSAARAAPIQYLTTPISVVLAWFFLGERLGVTLLLGTVLVVGGVVLTQRGRRIEPSATPVQPEPVPAET